MKPTVSIADRLAQVATRPQDFSLLERTARSLERRGEHAMAVQLLIEKGIHLNAHQEPSPMCLCRRCIAPERPECEHDSVRWRRDFVVVRGKVLFYWNPEELWNEAHRARRSVRQALHDRLLGPKGGRVNWWDDL